jgi:hypothetical protein
VVRNFDEGRKEDDVWKVVKMMDEWWWLEASDRSIWLFNWTSITKIKREGKK